MIEFNQLEYLAVMAQYGTLSKAAEALNTSQPVLSRTIYCLCRTEDRQPLAPVFREITVRGL